MFLARSTSRVYRLRAGLRLAQATPSTIAKRRSCSECTDQYAHKVLDGADIVRDAIYAKNALFI